MAYRCNENGRGDRYPYRTLEVALVEGDPSLETDRGVEVLVVDNSRETLRFVQENLADIAANLLRVKRAKRPTGERVEENAQMFEERLEPLFEHISATEQDHVLDKLSSSLKKALLLMAMDRFSCDSRLICRALGISKVQLERELRLCGLLEQQGG